MYILHISDIYWQKYKRVELGQFQCSLLLKLFTVISLVICWSLVKNSALNVSSDNDYYVNSVM